MPTVAALIRTDAERARLRELLQRIAVVRFCDTGPALTSVVTDAGVGVVLSELEDRTGASMRGTLAEIAVRQPMVCVCLYISLAPHELRDAIKIAATTGIREVLFRGSPEIAGVITTMLEGQRQCGAAAHIIAALDPRAGPALASFVRVCATDSTRPLAAAEAALMTRQPLRTLERRLRCAGLPSPHALIAWSRLLHVGWWLSQTAHSLKHIAGELHFQSVPALYAMFRHYVGCTPTVVRGDGGFETLLRAFEAFLDRQSGGDLSATADVSCDASA